MRRLTITILLKDKVITELMTTSLTNKDIKTIQNYMKSSNDKQQELKQNHKAPSNIKQNCNHTTRRQRQLCHQGAARHPWPCIFPLLAKSASDALLRSTAESELIGSKKTM